MSFMNTNPGDPPRPRITARTKCLTCGVARGKHKGRHPFRPKYPNMTDTGLEIDSETSSVSLGGFPVTFDVDCARAWGWSTRRIVRALDKLEKFIKPARATSMAQRRRP